MKKYDVVIIGGSLGGVFAALSVAKSGKNCVIVEECEWIGGQVTSQAVPPDEHEFIEEFGCTATYQEYRNRIREHYQSLDDLTLEAKSIKYLNPGKGWVGQLCHEPRVSLKVLYDMMDIYLKNGQIEIFNKTNVLEVFKDNDKILKVIVEKDGLSFEINGLFFLDATDTGSFLPLSKTEYSFGSENTDELHSNKIDNPLDCQAITWVAAIEYDENNQEIIEKPKYYDFFRSLKAPYDDNDVLSWYFQDPNTGKKRKYGLFDWPIDEDTNKVIPPLFTYRQIINGDYYLSKKNNVTIVNWGQNDYYLGSIIDNEQADYHLMMSKELTKSLVYWLQTEALRPDGGYGFPEIKLRYDLLGTDDGLAQAPYIRESRRIKALYTIKEEDILMKEKLDFPRFWDSIGIGWYKIDFHLTTLTYRNLFAHTNPFEIPLGALIPVKSSNLLASCKNIGTTHITNGCYRLHPIEANIGESAGYFASYCLDLNMTPHSIYKDQNLVKQFQNILRNNKIELSWNQAKVKSNNLKKV